MSGEMIPSCGSLQIERVSLELLTSKGFSCWRRGVMRWRYVVFRLSGVLVWQDMVKGLRDLAQFTQGLG